jgi:hypothetical protein
VRSLHSAASDRQSLAKTLIEIGCARDGGPYVIGRLMAQFSLRFQGFEEITPQEVEQEAKVAAAFLDESKCPGALGLSEENKAKLQAIRDRAPAPPGPDAAAR